MLQLTKCLKTYKCNIYFSMKNNKKNFFDFLMIVIETHKYTYYRYKCYYVSQFYIADILSHLDKRIFYVPHKIVL